MVYLFPATMNLIHALVIIPMYVLFEHRHKQAALGGTRVMTSESDTISLHEQVHEMRKSVLRGIVPLR